MNNKIKVLSLDNVNIELSKEGNLVKLKIEGEPEIILNDNIIYSPQNKKEYRFLPQNLVPFIEKYQEYINDEEDYLEIDLCIGGKIVTLYIAKNKNKKTFTARYDTSETGALSVLEGYGIKKIDIDKFKASKENMVNSLKDLGYELKYSHSQEEFIWCWSDIIFNIKNFNEEEFIKVSEIIFEHDKIIKELYNKI